MKKKSILALLLGAAPVVYGATGSLSMFDDADENSFNHAADLHT